MTIQEKFEEFHEANPSVYTELVKLARQARFKGHSKVGIELLFAVLRWERMMGVERNSHYKLNDHYTSRYARLIMREEWDLRSMFEVRELKAA